MTTLFGAPAVAASALADLGDATPSHWMPHLASYFSLKSLEAIRSSTCSRAISAGPQRLTNRVRTQSGQNAAMGL